MDRLPDEQDFQRGMGLTIETVNPHSKTHGAPSDEERHVGDMGNFKTDGQGNAKGSMEDKLIKLIGPESILGVSVLPFPLCHSRTSSFDIRFGIGLTIWSHIENHRYPRRHR